MNPADETSPALELLADRIQAEWLPSYLADQGYEPGSYLGGEQHLTDIDAFWFMRSVDEGIVTVLPKGRLELPRSPLKAMIFWEHSRSLSPRPVSLHREGVLSAGMAARLHLEFGWPVDRLGFEYPPDKPGRRAFDLAAIDADGSLRLAGEAKKAAGELRHVLNVMTDCGTRGPHEHAPDDKRSVNGHRKWQGLVRCQPQVFFTFGPAEDWTITRVSFIDEFRLELDQGTGANLEFGGA